MNKRIDFFFRIREENEIKDEKKVKFINQHRIIIIKFIFDSIFFRNSSSKLSLKRIHHTHTHRKLDEIMYKKKIPDQ